MALIDLTYFSDVLAKQTRASVLYPEKGSGPFPVFYLLHGLSDDHSMWLRQTRLETYMAGIPMIVVMPDGHRRFYTKNEEGPDYAKHLAEELPARIEAMFHAKTSGKARCIGGLSMGGYGALRLGLGYPSKYTSINSFSGALMVDNKQRRTWLPEFQQIFGDEPVGTEHDLTYLARKAKKTGKLPKIRVDCGTEDHLLEENRRFHRELDKLGIAHDYEEFPGGHNWDYWDLHIRQAIQFHRKALGM
jgi:S-formylglutathione hydrolase FrmB